MLDGLEDGVGQGAGAEVFGEPKVAGGGGQAGQVLLKPEDPRAVGSGAAEHGLEESDAVLQPGVEGGEAGLILGDEATVQENGGHSG